MEDANGHEPDAALEPAGELAAGGAAALDPAERLRGELFTGLDRLAFAIELEVAAAVDAGDGEKAVRLEERRLGVRLAQRYIAGVHADEVDGRIAGSRQAYDARTAGFRA